MSDDTDRGGFRDVRSIAVTTDDVVTALEAVHRGSKPAVLRVTPPFAGRMRARLHVEGAEGGYDDERTPVHIAPERLVEGAPPYPDPDRTEDELRAAGEEYSPETHRERHVEAVEAWRAAVRESVVDCVELEVDGGVHRLEVKTLG